MPALAHRLDRTPVTRDRQRLRQRPSRQQIQAGDDERDQTEQNAAACEKRHHGVDRCTPYVLDEAVGPHERDLDDDKCSDVDHVAGGIGPSARDGS
ncbi:hypothetical protein [Sphingomonas bacterium]|uniref:hypothetical protein n=1 Tax=Sphingomonas bacterium TaxID=1895847 RepID=UPI0015772CC7|nr:hypothetical protein [Sphingomonas bacterium]